MEATEFVALMGLDVYHSVSLYLKQDLKLPEFKFPDTAYPHGTLPLRRDNASFYGFTDHITTLFWYPVGYEGCGDACWQPWSDRDVREGRKTWPKAPVTTGYISH